MSDKIINFTGIIRAEVFKISKSMLLIFLLHPKEQRMGSLGLRLSDFNVIKCTYLKKEAITAFVFLTTTTLANAGKKSFRFRFRN